MIEIRFDKEKKQAIAYDNNIKIGKVATLKLETAGI